MSYGQRSTHREFSNLNTILSKNRVVVNSGRDMQPILMQQERSRAMNGGNSECNEESIQTVLMNTPLFTMGYRNSRFG